MKLSMIGAMLACAVAVGACGGSKADAPKADAPKADAPKESHVSAPLMDVNDPHVMTIAVPTMQCETCAAAITKGVKGVSEAQDVKVDVDTKTVFVKVANNTPDTRRQIEQTIAGVGYSTKSVQRDPAAYAKLPECCKEKKQ
ncbi:MAG: heavy-metal-associated domain-containing protein [Bacteroidetes bacterium]|nr:heavy-metal-associated domain-containing protein [Bacteroidota bacterium]